MLTLNKAALSAVVGAFALGVAASAQATTYPTSGTFSGTVSSDVVGFGVYSQSQTLSGVDATFGSFTQTAFDYAVFTSFTDFTIEDGTVTTTFSGGKVFADFSGSGHAVAGGFDVASSFTVTGGTGLFAGVSGALTNTTFDTNAGAISGSYTGTFSTAVSAVPLPGALPLFGTALAGLAGLAARTSRRAVAT